MNIVVIQQHLLQVIFVYPYSFIRIVFFSTEQFQNLDPKREESMIEFSGLVSASKSS
jgi:hypothetical protein